MTLGAAVASRMAAHSGINFFCRSHSSSSYIIASMYRCSSLLCRQMSTEAENVAVRLQSSGLLRTKSLIGGKWIDAYDGKVMEVTNPSTGDVIANVSCMGTRETNDAISAAYDAYSCMEL